VTRHLIGAGPDENLASATAKYLSVDTYSTAIKRLDWLGLFGDRPLPEGKDNPLDWLNVLTLEKMSLAEGERDMIVMNHEFVAEFPNHGEKITSTLLDFGVPGGDTSIARTVSLPAAIAVRMILEGKISSTGVRIPVEPEIYQPILDELATLGVQFQERKESL
jgi:saccharopine dehydrogenase (NADP+, L-glutamate forming)